MFYLYKETIHNKETIHSILYSVNSNGMNWQLCSFTLDAILFMVSGGKLCFGSVPCLKASTFWANGNDRMHMGPGHTTSSGMLNILLMVVLACSSTLFCCSSVTPAMLLLWHPLLCLGKVTHQCLTGSILSTQGTWGNSGCQSFVLLGIFWLLIQPLPDVLSLGQNYPVLWFSYHYCWRICLWARGIAK